ncbi:MAG: hypothetical protein COA73_07625 [Candidatus Hydrogenedentota bacterium]|nr:MAG: hypothetical protein COA73_07625 [Candidatus Hydrogenedentota bacterium]
MHYGLIKKRIQKIEALSSERAKIPKPLLSGRELMQFFNLSSGPKVGNLLGLIREEQLTGHISTKEEALSFLKDRLDTPLEN